MTWWVAWAVLALLVVWLLVDGGPAPLVAVLAWLGGWVAHELADQRRRRGD